MGDKESLEKLRDGLREFYKSYERTELERDVIDLVGTMIQAQIDEAQKWG